MKPLYFLVVAMMFPFVAIAQALDAGTPDAGIVLSDDPAALAQMIIDAIATKQWWVVASAAVLLLTWALRSFGSKISPKISAFLMNPIVSWALPSVLALLGGVTVTLVSHKPLVAATLIGEVLKVSFGAIAMYVGAKKIAEARSAGATAAGAVTTKADAIKVIVNETKGPNP